MRILMLGNSFTYFNDMPEMLAALTGWEVIAHTRGGAYLFEHLDAQAELGKKTLPLLKKERFDYVVLQEQSRGAYEKREQFLESVRALCALAREAGATPVLYSTWAYKSGSKTLSDTGLTHDVMLRGISEGYLLAAKENDALLAPVGSAFAALRHKLDLYTPDCFHPSPSGSLLAASVIEKTIRAHAGQA